MMLTLIAAMSENGVIGKNNQLPWHLSEDLKRFKQLTMNHPIIMGRKTFESIGKPLPGRDNWVLSKNPAWTAPGVEVAPNLETVLDKIGNATQPFVIGGAQVYKAALALPHQIYLTVIEKHFDGDAVWPEWDWKMQYTWEEESELFYSEKEKLPYRFLRGIRK